MTKALSSEQINSFISDSKGWTVENDSLKKDFEFADFKSAMTFLVRVGFEAEAKGHHPEIFNVYNKVTIALNTHDAGNKITEKDTALAAAIDKIEK